MPGIIGYVCMSAEPAPRDLRQRYLETQQTYRTRGYLRIITETPELSAFLSAPSISKAPCGSAANAVAGVTVAFYGELFDGRVQPEGKGSAGESLLRFCLNEGLEAAADLDGCYCYLGFDALSHKLVLATDYCGSRPVFYAMAGNCLVFAPDPAAAAYLAGAEDELNPGAFGRYLAAGSLARDTSFFHAVRCLRPGHLLGAENGEAYLRCYYRYAPSGETEDLGEAAYIEGLRPLLWRAVEKRTRHLEHSVVPISGGLDSRGILGCLARLSERKVVTVSWGESETVPGADAAIGRQISNLLGTAHRFIPRKWTERFGENCAEMTELVDGMTIDPAMHHNEYRMLVRLKEKLGAEYLFRGDEMFGYHGSAETDAEALAAIGLYSLGDLPDSAHLLRPEFREAVVSEADAQLRETVAECPFTDFTDRKEYYRFYERMFGVLHRSNYYKLAAMEVGNPWLDREIFDFYRNVPVKYRVWKTLYKATLNAMFPELMAIPLAQKNSLEDWAGIFRTNQEIQTFVRRSVLEHNEAPGFFKYFDEAAVREFVEACFRGEVAPAIGKRVMRTAKDSLRKYAPGVFRAIKRQAMGRLRTAYCPPEQVLFRLVVLSLRRPFSHRIVRSAPGAKRKSAALQRT